MDESKLATEGRDVALRTLKTRGPWSRTAAGEALSGDTADVVSYLRSGRVEATQEDERSRVETLALESPASTVRSGAEQALGGDTARISSFLKSGQYEAMADDLRVYISKVISTGGPSVQSSGRTALSSGSVDKYRTFVTDGQDTARTEDERVRAAQLIDSGGSEVKAAARIALEGPAPLLHAFIQRGQYQAQRKDQLAASHVALLQQMISEAASVAATAQKNAAEAGKVAATARKAAAEAAEYSKQADASAKAAKGYADDAAKSAKEAETSAANAAVSARTARAAEADAHAAAARAISSAAEAQGSANWAQGSADEAWSAAREARASATAAGKDSAAAGKAMLEAFQTAVSKQLQEEAEFRKTEDAWRNAPDPEGPPEEDDGWIPDWLEDKADTVLIYGEAILTNPDLWAGLAETGTGVLMMGVGVSGDIAGGALCITGIGCLAGCSGYRREHDPGRRGRVHQRRRDRPLQRRPGASAARGAEQEQRRAESADRSGAGAEGPARVSQSHDCQGQDARAGWWRPP